MRWRRALLGLATALVVAVGAAIVLDWLFPPDLRRLQAVGTEVHDRNGRVLALLPAAGGVWRFRTEASQVPPHFRDLLIAVEDRRFWSHPGVDPIALARAAVQWVRAGRVVSGGSTLSMQAARLLEPRPRTLRSKLIEMARAVQLEAHFGKQGVLGIWLTLAPYGGNLEGVRAGSLAWFGIPSERLEPEQAALLVAIPRRPEALRPDRHADRAEALRARVLHVAAAEGLWDRGTPPPVPHTRVRLPRHAPQVVTPLARAMPGATVVPTTLDRGLQSAVERLAAEKLETLPDRASLAILVADAPDRVIRAIHGGAWGEVARAGSLDLTRAIRSPGSALKPFIYAMAFQDGIAGPDTVLADLPRQFGAYAPENFDRGFAGTLTAGEALRRSLNVPAVGMLERVGPVRFLASLRGAGARLVLPDGADPSLPLALGGVGITLRDLAGLYAALATDGRFTPLRLGGEAAPSHPLLGTTAARSVADVLTVATTRGVPPGIAWKTGTSWGGRDAWAMGFNARHVVGVWVGRPDGTPLAGATGISLALPLMARVFDLLPAEPRIPARPERAPLATGLDAPTADALRLLFPPPGAVLSADGQVTIRAMGGRRPLTFLVDGVKLPTEPVRREAAWLPPSAGFYRVTVLDADGSAAHARVRVKP